MMSFGKRSATARYPTRNPTSRILYKRERRGSLAAYDGLNHRGIEDNHN